MLLLLVLCHAEGYLPYLPNYNYICILFFTVKLIIIFFGVVDKVMILHLAEIMTRNVPYHTVHMTYKTPSTRSEHALSPLVMGTDCYYY
jgi:hypothetical protein